MGNHPSSVAQLHEAIKRDNYKAVQYFLKTTRQDINIKVMPIVSDETYHIYLKCIPIGNCLITQSDAYL